MSAIGMDVSGIAARLAAMDFARAAEGLTGKPRMFLLSVVQQYLQPTGQPLAACYRTMARVWSQTGTAARAPLTLRQVSARVAKLDQYQVNTTRMPWPARWFEDLFLDEYCKCPFATVEKAYAETVEWARQRQRPTISLAECEKLAASRSVQDRKARSDRSMVEQYLTKTSLGREAFVRRMPSGARARWASLLRRYAPERRALIEAASE